MSPISTQISSLRRSRSLTMDQLAQAAGVSRMTVQRVEAGADVRLQTLEDILRVLGMELMLGRAAMRRELEQVAQSEGRVLGRPVGVEAPPSVVDEIRKGSADSGSQA